MLLNEVAKNKTEMNKIKQTIKIGSNLFLEYQAINKKKLGNNSKINFV